MIKALLGNEKGSGSFLILITTLNMLLLAFFIVLNSIAVIDENKKRSALDSVVGALGLLSSGMSPGMSGEKKTSPSSVEMTRLEKNLLEILHRVEQFAIKEHMEKDISVQFGKKGILVHLTNRVTFEEGKAVLRPAAKKILNDVGMLFSRTLGSINIIGHTSPGGYIKGPYPDDWSLSFARAGTAARFLMSSSGIKPERFSISGYGSTRPRTAGESPQDKVLNDRIGLILDRRKI